MFPVFNAVEKISQQLQWLGARVVYPVDAPPIENGYVAIADDRIAGAGRIDRADGAVEDLGDVVLLPGLVNAHAHLEFSHLTRPLASPDGRFCDWIRAVISERQRRSFRPAAAIAAGCRESLQAGVTTVGDVATNEARAYPQDEQSPQLTLFREVIGFSLARADSAFAAACDELTALEDLTAHRNGTCVGISPHAPYTVSPKLVTDLVATAAKRHIPVAMHLAESREELELLRQGSGPLRELLEERSMWDEQAIPQGSCPLNYLNLLVRAPRALVIHGNYLTEKELAFMAEARDRLTLVHCPRTHAYFQHDSLDLVSIANRGVRIALGTDSRASNPDLSLWSEMRHLAARQTALAPVDILRMGTLTAAEALGREASEGSLAVGKLGNLVAMRVPAAISGDADKLLSAVLESASSPSQVWLRGRRIGSQTVS